MRGLGVLLHTSSACVASYEVISLCAWLSTYVDARRLRLMPVCPNANNPAATLGWFESAGWNDVVFILCDETKGKIFDLEWLR